MNKQAITIIYLVISLVLIYLTLNLISLSSDTTQLLVSFLLFMVVGGFYPFVCFANLKNILSKIINKTKQDIEAIIRNTPNTIHVKKFLLPYYSLILLGAMLISVSFSFNFQFSKIGLIIGFITLLISYNFFESNFKKWYAQLKENISFGVLKQMEIAFLQELATKTKPSVIPLTQTLMDNLPKYLQQKYPNIDNKAMIAGISALAGYAEQCSVRKKSPNSDIFKVITTENGDRLCDCHEVIQVLPPQISANFTFLYGYNPTESMRILMPAIEEVKQTIGTPIFGIPKLLYPLNGQPHPHKILVENWEYCCSMFGEDLYYVPLALLSTAYWFNFKNEVLGLDALTKLDFQILALESAISTSKIDFEQVKTKVF